MKNKSKKTKIIVAILVGLLLVYSLFMTYVERVMLPRGAEILHSYAETNMFEILNETIGEVTKKYSATYEDIVDVKYASDGDITALTVNQHKVNAIKSEIAMVVSKKLSQQDEIPVYVPVGAFLNNIYLMGKGPRIKFILVQRGCVQTDFEHSFESAGVNQVLHTLKIILDADVALMLPFYDTHTYMQTSAILAQTVISGDIPDYYLTKENS
ncbi:MAG: sporulation protein YunB [Clostridia bacterium]|nr:sporulation protein YunB [Clostridia bacterium]